jgi:hypothetical protein
MAPNKLADPLLGLGVKVLELVQGGKLLHIQPVGRDDVGLALEKMLSLEAGDVGHGREHVGQVGTGSFDAVAVVDLALPSFFVDIELNSNINK